ncbi:MAG: phosphoenolpyruvate--protein phosphotransferase [Lentisphaeria bacterium]|nr:phosphoenolpyruvate--protein phosphotransferase [Lentisphaeria bacterium]
MKESHLNFLCDVNALSALLVGSSDLDSFLQKIVDLVADHMDAEVCSIYFYDEHKNDLYLKVTHGLNQEALNSVRLNTDEGLVGKAFSSRHFLLEDKASSNPAYKGFSNLNEDRYEAFLAVPIVRGEETAGVIVVQRQENYSFDSEDRLTLQATASQLASAIENARLLVSLSNDNTESIKPPHIQECGKVLAAQVASDGFAYEKSLLLDKTLTTWEDVNYTPVNQLEKEDFELALVNTQQQLEELEFHLEEKLPEMAAMIFGAHLMMLKDPEFTGAMSKLVDSGVAPSIAIKKVCQKYIEIFQNSKSPYIREKTADVKDLGRRLLGNLQGKVYEPTTDCAHKVVFAHEVFPSDLIKLASENVAGVVCETGGITSHVSILARSLKIPMVILQEPVLHLLPKTSMVLLDTTVGNVYINPQQEIVDTFLEGQKLKSQAASYEVKAETFTCCEEKVNLLANINLLSDLTHACNLQAEGIGLYRTEFPFIIRSYFPDELEQLKIYEHLMQKMPDKIVTIRTLDIGGDKLLNHMPELLDEENPAMGLRSIRFSLRYLDIFKTQVRAILRACPDHRGLRIMFPMISSLEELIQAKAIIRECQEELKDEGHAFHQDPEIGIMVEVPSIIPIIDDLAEESDFFCVGTNDFIQFLLAVDRVNDRVAKYFVPHHPAVLRSLKVITDSALRNNVNVSICGEMAHEKLYVPYLLGLGVRSLSVDSRFIPEMQQSIQKMKLEECKELVNKVNKEIKINRIQELLEAFPN